MPTTFKPVVYSHQKRRDGTYNVKIRVTHNRQSRNLATETNVTPDQLTRGLKIKDARVLDAMDAIIKKMRDAVMDIGFAATVMDVDRIVDEIRKRLNAAERFSLDFYEYGVKYYDGIKTGTRRSYISAFSAILRYCNGRHPDVNEITARWLRGFLDYLNTTGVGAPSARLYLSKLSHVHGLAKREFNDEDSGVIKIPGNPFTGVETPSAAPARGHQAVETEVMQAVIDMPEDPRINSRRNVARDMFIMSFGLQGINLADIWDAREDPAGFITFTRKKTSGSRPVQMCLRIEPEIRPYIDRYTKGGYIIGKLRERYRVYQTFFGAVNRGTQNLSDTVGTKFIFYAARHSWATYARNLCKIDKWDVHEALTHSDAATKIDDVYIAPDYSKFWAANRAVLDLFRWSTPGASPDEAGNAVQR